jgi:adenylate cyclase
MTILSETWRGLWSESEPAGLPERVRAQIRAQQDRSEILIGWFQLVVVVTFGTLYLVSPKTFSEDSAFAPVPWALASYLVLTVVRLVWAHRGRLPNWSLAISVIFDMSLLMVLIWSFHLQYQQPPSFFLKAPTLLYVFIFIALRALRFEARFVLLAGLVAAFGWGFMILYVVYVDPTDTMITRDYVEYMTSNAILLGAEFDKILSILMVTAIIAFALQRAKGLLVRAVAEQAAARELSRFFDPEVAQRIKGSEQEIRAGSGELRDAAVLNLDMRGFTRLAGRVPPEEVMRLLGEYQTRMVAVVQKHGGTIDKFLGDGIMATFGAVWPSDSYAADSVTALEAALADARAWQTDCEAAGRACPEVNGSVVTGRVLFGAVDDEARLEYTVIGDAVNLSAKIEKANKDLGVRGVCDAETFRLAKAQGYQPSGAPSEQPAVEVAGVSKPIDLVVLAA